MQEWQDFTYSSTDGLKLAGRKYGWENREAMPAVCLPGLTRNSADFHELAVHLSSAEKPRRVLTLDYRGRGQSEYDRDHENYNIITEADDVLQGITAAGLEHVNIIGTSRGGLITMLLGALRPGIMNSIVMNDVGPEIAGPGLVRIKAYIEKTRDPESWKEAADFLKEIGQHNFPEWNDEIWDRQARLIFTERDGKIVRNYDPNLYKTLKAIDLDTRLPSMWPQFEGLTKIPLMLVRGANTDLLAEATVEKMQDMHDAMRVVDVANQGHAPDLGSDNLPEKIASFLSVNESH